jgi:hypothetical protein
VSLKEKFALANGSFALHQGKYLGSTREIQPGLVMKIAMRKNSKEQSKRERTI